MPKFNPHPLFPENPLYEIHSEAEIPHSDRYELWCDGRRQTVYHTDSFDYAVVVRKNSEHFPVEIHVSTRYLLAFLSSVKKMLSALPYPVLSK